MGTTQHLSPLFAQAMFKRKAMETEEERALQEKYAALRKMRARAVCGSRAEGGDTL
jgi:hypothetical protein